MGLLRWNDREDHHEGGHLKERKEPALQRSEARLFLAERTTTTKALRQEQTSRTKSSGVGV